MQGLYSYEQIARFTVQLAEATAKPEDDSLTKISRSVVESVKSNNDPDRSFCKEILDTFNKLIQDVDVDMFIAELKKKLA